MRFVMLFCVACSVSILALGEEARASQGQLGLEPRVASEVGILRHPGARYEGVGGSINFVPRLGLHLVYGLTNRWDLSIGVDAAAMPIDVIARGVGVQSHQFGDLYATYHDLFVPLRLSYRFTNGGDWSFLVAAASGVLLTHWQDRYLLPVGAADSPATMSKNIERRSQWYTELFGSAALSAEWRPSDWFSLMASPYVAVSSNRNIYVGVNLFADFLLNFGGFTAPY